PPQELSETSHLMFFYICLSKWASFFISSHLIWTQRESATTAPSFAGPDVPASRTPPSPASSSKRTWPRSASRAARSRSSATPTPSRRSADRPRPHGRVRSADRDIVVDRRFRLQPERVVPPLHRVIREAMALHGFAQSCAIDALRGRQARVVGIGARIEKV